MRVLDVRLLLDTIFHEELGLHAGVDALEFIHRHHADVYRLRAGGVSYIAHVTPDGMDYLRHTRDNLQRLSPLHDDRIPRVVAWRDGTTDGVPGREWAVLVSSEISGEELSPRSFTPQVWASLCDLLQRVHALPADAEPCAAACRPVHEPAAFRAFAETLLLRLRDLPIRPERVRRHLEAMARYVTDQADGFRIPPRLIHGDLNRSNVRVDGDRAGVVDWSDLAAGDYAYDLAMLKFMMDSVAPRLSTGALRRQCRDYRLRWRDDTLELRMRFFLALPGLFSAFFYASQPALFPAARAWRVRACYLHSESQWQAPLRLDGDHAGAPATRTEHWAVRLPQPLRGVFYLVAPKRVA